MKNEDGHYNPDGSFVFDYEKISRETGFSIEAIKSHGVSWCRRNTPRDKAEDAEFNRWVDYSGCRGE